MFVLVHSKRRCRQAYGKECYYYENYGSSGECARNHGNLQGPFQRDDAGAHKNYVISLCCVFVLGFGRTIVTFPEL